MKENVLYRKKEQDVLSKIQLGSGIKDFQVKDVFMFWVYEFFSEYQKDNKTILPYVGEVTLSYDGDVETNTGTQAKASMNIELCDEFLKMIGQLSDGVETDFERKVQRRIKTSLSNKLAEK